MCEEYNVQLPYPEISGEISAREVEWLYDLYAGRFSEMTAITSYFYQSVIVGSGALQKLLLNISIVEMEHLERLGEALVRFGADPVLAGKYSYFTCDYTNYSKDVRDFLTTDIEGEINAKKEYLTFANRTKNASLCELLTRIALDEELHIELLKQAYFELFGERIEIKEI